MLLDRFSDSLRRAFPELEGKRVVVALSGGRDSVALLHLLQRSSMRLDLEAAHVHHGVRGAEADADAAFCDELCERLGIPFHLVRLELPERRPDGREATWRRLRYRALHDVAEACGAAAVATGHHADDVAEGVLVQLLRGAGPRAMAGIAARTPSGLVRPLLGFRRDELGRWLEDNGLVWREDSSNRDPSHLRNRVRNDLLPELARVAPAVHDHLVSLADTLARDETILSEELRRRALFIDPWHPAGGVPVAVVRRLPAALRPRWLLAQAERTGLSTPSRSQLRLFEALLDASAPRAVSLGDRWRLRSARGVLWLEPPGAPPAFDLPLSRGETVGLPLPTWAARLRGVGDPPGDPVWSLQIEGDGPVHVRSPRDGDAVGGSGGRPRRLAGVLAEALPRHLRKAWPVLCVADTIHWIPGVWRRTSGAPPGRVVVEVLRR
jgi:tRNA(Ile)-lysidine synthetase-like protein